MSTSAFLQMMLAKRRPIPLIAVRANITFCFPSTLVFWIRRMCWNSSFATRAYTFYTTKIKLEKENRVKSNARLDGSESDQLISRRLTIVRVFGVLLWAFFSFFSSWFFRSEAEESEGWALGFAFEGCYWEGLKESWSTVNPSRDRQMTC